METVSGAQVWSPVCGPYFWDNNNGATAICRKLGFLSGKFYRRSYSRYDVQTRKFTANSIYKDAMPVGKCRAGEELHKCTGGGNAWGNLTKYSNCKKGQNAAVEISCHGGRAGPSSRRTAAQKADTIHEETQVLLRLTIHSASAIWQYLSSDARCTGQQQFKPC